MNQTSPEGPTVRGTMLAARLEYVGSVYSPLGLEKVLEALPPEDRERLRHVAEDTWYPFASLLRLDRAIAAVLAPGDPEIYDRLGEASAGHRTRWLGDHASLVSVHALLARVAEEHPLHQGFGRAAYRRTHFTEAEMQFSGYPVTDKAYCASARGFLRGVVKRVTRGAVLVEETQCQCAGDPACVFSIRWGG